MILAISLMLPAYFVLGIYALILVTRYHSSQIPDGPQFLLAWLLWPVAFFWTGIQILTTELPKWINKKALFEKTKSA